MFRHRFFSSRGILLSSFVTPQRWRVRSVHRFIFTVVAVSMFVTTLLVVSDCISNGEQCLLAPSASVYSNHRVVVPESVRAKVAAARNFYQDEDESYVDPDNVVEVVKDSDHDSVHINLRGGRVPSESREINRVLDSIDVDYSVKENADDDVGDVNINNGDADENRKPAPVSISKKRPKSPPSKALKLYSQKGISLREQFNCKKLFEGDIGEQEKAYRFTERHNFTFPTLSFEEVPDMLADCEAFKTARNYKTNEHVSEEERDFPIAYVILAHLDFEHVERLIRTLYTPQNVFCIHLDTKAPESLNKALKALASCFPDNIMMSSNPQRIVYAHMSRLMADISCMRDLVERRKPWRYLINMAATELPLRSNLETIHVLKTLHGLNDIREVETGKVEERFQFVHEISKAGRMRRTQERLPPPPHNLTIVKGLAYNTYSREFMDFAMTDQRSLDLLAWSELTFSPDEHYWATLNDLYHNAFLNTPGGFKGHPDKKGYITKFINWQQTPLHKCWGRIIHNICLFSALDLPYLLDKRELAANKFDLSFDPIAYACMEEELENRTRDARPLDLSTYKRLYFIRFDPEKDLVKVDKKRAKNTKENMT